MDRPTGRKWEQVVEVAHSLCLGLSIKAVSERADMPTRATIARWRTQHWWQDAVVEAEARYMQDVVAKARANVARAVEEGDVATSKWLLGLRDKQFYAPKVRNELHGAEPDHAHRPLGDLSDEELATLATADTTDAPPN